MTDAPIVSVVMPVLNESRTVVAAVTSVLRQTLSDLEVIVVDGASTDDTVRQVESIAATDSRVRLLSNHRRTIPHALNIGRRAARGTYLARVDAHARVNDTYLERAVAELRSAPDVAAVGGMRIGVASTPTGRAVAAALSSRFGVGGSINHYARERQDTDHASFGVFRAEVLEEVGGWDERLLVNEDVDIDHRILGLGYRIRYDPGMHIYWHVRETLPDFARQYRRYGRGKAFMVRKNGAAAVRPRHLAAPALVLGLLAGGALAAAGRRLPLALLGAAYGSAVVGASVREVARSDEDVSVPRVAAAFAVMHGAWGTGFLEGVLAARPPAMASGR